MASERELLERLIKEKLTSEKAEFEVNVGKVRIDLVFEKEEEIWIIEAKRVLNYDALGQVLTYEKPYKDQFSPSKDIKLGIVCEEGNPEIEQACQDKGVKVFVLEVGEKKVERKPSRDCQVGEMDIYGFTLLAREKVGDQVLTLWESPAKKVYHIQDEAARYEMIKKCDSKEEAEKALKEMIEKQAEPE